MERNANQIISLYCHLPVSCRSLVDRCGSPGSCKPQMEKGRSAFKILTGKPKGRRPLGRSRSRREDNIRTYLKEIGINARNWVSISHGVSYVYVHVDFIMGY